MVKRILLVLAILALITGCSTQEQKIKYEIVKVPVYTVPMPPKLDRPSLPIKSLTEEEKEDEGILSQAYASSLARVTNYARALEMVVEEYRNIAIYSKKMLEDANIDNEPPPDEKEENGGWFSASAPIPSEENYIESASDLNPYKKYDVVNYGGTEYKPENTPWDYMQWYNRYKAQNKFKEIEREYSKVVNDENP